MRIGVRLKLFALSFLLVAVSTVLVFSYARGELETRIVAEIEADLRVRAALSAQRAKLAAEQGADRSIWQALVHQLAEASGARATVIRLDGVVLGESTLSAEQLGTVENHSLRPEVRDALRHGVGISRRHSSTTTHELLYVAVPIRAEHGLFGVMRLALPLTAVGSQVAALQRALSIGAALALGLALITAYLAAEFGSRAARKLTAVARQMASGDLEVRIPQMGRDEFGQLGRALEQLARSLSEGLYELRGERDRMGGLLSRMHEGVLLLDQAGRVRLVNPALRGMLLLHDDAEGKLPLEVIRHVELKRLIDEVTASQVASEREIEVGGLKPRVLRVRVAPVGGEVGGIFAVFFDVTEMRRLESLRRDFVANVSHELRTPVTAIRSAAETLRNALTRDPHAAPRFVDIIERNADRLGSLVEDLLDLSRIESRELKLVNEDIAIPAMLQQVLSLFRERADRKGLTLQVEARSDLPCVVADRRALENVLANLVDNAVKYSGSGTVVRVRGVQSSEGVRLVVEDTGPGIDAAHLPRLFERFYRVDNGRSRDLGGTGLGLSIVKHLVESMGSQIAVESEPGVGTRFAFTLRESAKTA